MASQLMSVMVETEDQLKALMRLYDKEDFDFWGSPSMNESTNVLVTPDQRMKFTKYLDSFRLKGQVVIDDIYRVVRNQQKNLVKFKQANEMSWDAYHYPETLQSRYRNLVEVITIGYSYEEMPLQMLKISTGNSEQKFGIHAREWISPAVATYIINELVQNASINDDLFDTYDFYILPIINPDGYRHSCNYNRFWRKSRRSFSFLTDLVGCRGIDLNRNFAFHWKEWGAGFSPCSMIYAGSSAFSEPETRAIRDFVKTHSEINWKFYFSLHSFGQKWMTPWGYTKERPQDYDEMLRVANIGNDALYAVHGTKYRVGSIRETLYTASGTSSDWFKSIGVDYSYAIELRDYGLFGFLLPAYQIIPTSEEVWAGIRASLLDVRANEIIQRLTKINRLSYD
ncbi:Carboxypeptidase B [Orchesella cincta]|uniref:Carboxypeptidase B n=1 Tax=Orchesella cincta TaxID=48709 RepID=A0A1D2MZJ0_ORCCI|nr:Carboxypeptidase B [Orchesella cincta]